MLLTRKTKRTLPFIVRDNCVNNFYIMFIISILTFLTTIHASQAANTLSYCGQPKTWVEAKVFCEQKGGRLLNRDTDNDAVFRQRTDIPLQQEIWIGHYRGLSGWMEHIGCFSQRSLGVSWYGVKTENNSAAICQTICNATDYFALQGSTCLCSYNNFVNTSWLTPETKCNMVCPGNGTEQCGGSNSINVYHRVHGNLIQYQADSYPNLHCAMMNCSSTTEWTYMEHECHNNLTALCGSGVLVNEPATWLTAQSLCKNYGSLVGIHNMVSNCAVSNDVKREFWIGVYRNYVDLVLKDLIVQNPVFGCYSLRKESSNVKPTMTFYPIAICEKQNMFSFICELPPGYPTSDGCYLPPSSSTSTTTPGTQLIQEQDDDGLKIGLFIALGLVLLAAVIVILILIARKSFRSNPEQLRHNILLAALANVKLRRRDTDGNPESSTPQKAETSAASVEGGSKSPEYAVVNKPGRRQSAPAPSCKVYSKPVTSLSKEYKESVPVSNNGYDKMRLDNPIVESENPQENDNQVPITSILKLGDSLSSDTMSPRRASIQDEEYNRNNGRYVYDSRLLSIPKKVIPVPPPVVKYPPEYTSDSYEHIGTTLL
ncbi:uncharacterized protein LOC134707157 isoform X2 [Mytilus trossulus]|uniref:uncharacterized protein LOC134707157 isoform X2 n=1 Tax=Mytilus trossulus TaxID=6551 RepID=UPI003005915C